MLINSEKKPKLSNPSRGWIHIELGAANYAGNPKADISHKGAESVDSEKQYAVLFSTVENLIQRRGPRGIFYINDFKKSDVTYTIMQLSAYIKQFHSDAEIEIQPLVGDFFKIDLSTIKADSIHLKNPEYWFFMSLDKEENRMRLAYFANCCEEGLTFITYFKRPFLNRLEKLEVGYTILNPNYASYFHADGSEIKAFGNIIEFSIKSKSTLEKEEQHEYITKYSYRPTRLPLKIQSNEAQWIDKYGEDAYENHRSVIQDKKYMDSYFVPRKEEMENFNRESGNDTPLNTYK